jgi:glycosyltransferase involved in cell wall biosynthesis
VVHCTYLLWGLSVRLPSAARRAGIPSVLTLTDYGLLCHRAQMVDWRLERCGGPHPPAVCARCIRAPSRFELGTLTRPVRRAAGEALAALGGFGRVPTAADLALREAAVREALEAVAVLIAPTRALAEVFVRAGVARERIAELVYAIDEAPLAAARAVPAGVPAIGFLGQFAPHKGLATLLAAVEIMRARLPESVMPWEVRLYGSPSGGRHRRYWPSLAERVRRAGPPRLSVMPAFPASDAPRVLAELSAVALPSIWDENAPLVALQARAAGVPVLGSSVPGIREVIEHGVHGQLVPPGDAAALADALRELLIAGRRRTDAPGLPLGLGEHVERLEAIYERALGRPASLAGS